MRWLQRYVPEFEKRWIRLLRRSGRSRRVDETYLKLRGRWVYLHGAVDRNALLLSISSKPSSTLRPSFSPGSSSFVSVRAYLSWSIS
jgi:hypothetical protein